MLRVGLKLIPVNLQYFWEKKIQIFIKYVLFIFNYWIMFITLNLQIMHKIEN